MPPKAGRLSRGEGISDVEPALYTSQQDAAAEEEEGRSQKSSPKMPAPASAKPAVRKKAKRSTSRLKGADLKQANSAEFGEGAGGEPPASSAASVADLVQEIAAFRGELGMHCSRLLQLSARFEGQLPAAPEGHLQASLLSVEAAMCPAGDTVAAQSLPAAPQQASLQVAVVRPKLCLGPDLEANGNEVLQDAGLVARKSFLPVPAVVGNSNGLSPRDRSPRGQTPQSPSPRGWSARLLSPRGFVQKAPINVKFSDQDDTAEATSQDEDDEEKRQSQVSMRRASTNTQFSHSLFADQDEVRATLYRSLFDEYRVEDLYHTEGVCQCIAKNGWFEVFIIALISGNALWVGFEVDMNPADALPLAPAGFQLTNNILCALFVFEIGVRYGAFASKRDAFRDVWFLLDFILALLMVVETWFIYPFYWFSAGGESPFSGAGAVSVLRMLRLSRVFRIIHVMHLVPELMVLLKGMYVASRSVLWTMGLLVLVIYVFAVGLKILCKGTNLGQIDADYHSVPGSMATLLLRGLLPDPAEHVYSMGKESFWFALIFMVFLIFAAITIMNMLVGVLVEVVSTIATVEREACRASYVKTKLKKLMETLDTDKNGELSKQEVDQLIGIPEAARVMRDVGVDVIGLFDLVEFHFFDNDKEEISYSEFTELVLQLRGTNTVCVRDVVNLRKFIREEFAEFLEAVQSGRTSCRRTLRTSMLGVPPTVA